MSAYQVVLRLLCRKLRYTETLVLIGSAQEKLWCWDLGPFFLYFQVPPPHTERCSLFPPSCCNFKDIILFSKSESIMRITGCLTFTVAHSVSDRLERNTYIQRHFSEKTILWVYQIQRYLFPKVPKSVICWFPTLLDARPKPWAVHMPAVLQIKCFTSFALMASAWKQTASFWEVQCVCWMWSHTVFSTSITANHSHLHPGFKAVFDPGGISHLFCFGF